MRRKWGLLLCLFVQVSFLVVLAIYSALFEVYATTTVVPIVVSKESFSDPTWEFTPAALDQLDFPTIFMLSKVSFEGGNWLDSYENKPGKIVFRSWRGQDIVKDVFVNGKPATNVEVGAPYEDACQTDLEPLFERYSRP